MSDKSTKAIYVCGPMTGIPQFNYPLFAAVTAQLRADTNRVVISPAEQDTQKMQDLAKSSPDGNLAWLEKQTGETWGDVLARDVKLIEQHIGAFALLPNWTASRGAKLEVFVGLLCGITEFTEVYETQKIDDESVKGIYLHGLTLGEVRDRIRENMP